jgi:CO/xanthine dehydrogenase Mo-binding subunit
MKFSIGQPMRRHEDVRLITGRGRYTDDVILPLSAVSTRETDWVG